MPERERLSDAPARREGVELELYSAIYWLTKEDFINYRL